MIDTGGEIQNGLMGINHLVRSTFQSQFLCSGHSFDDAKIKMSMARMDYKIDVLE